MPGKDSSRGCERLFFFNSAKWNVVVPAFSSGDAPDFACTQNFFSKKHAHRIFFLWNSQALNKTTTKASYWTTTLVGSNTPFLLFFFSKWTTWNFNEFFATSFHGVLWSLRSNMTSDWQQTQCHQRQKSPAGSAATGNLSTWPARDLVWFIFQKIQ